MNIAVVWNPSKTEREDLERALTAAADVEIAWFETAEDDPGRAATEEAIAGSPEIVFAAGGDGTVRAVAEVLAETADAPALGILPLGTGNLLARNLDVPLKLEEAAAHAFAAADRRIDFGWVSTHTDAGGEDEKHGFAVMVGFGIDANMIAETDDDLKAKAGWLAYVESLGRALSDSDVVDVRISLDDHRHETTAHTVIVGNCGTIQGGITLLPEADPADGKLDVLMLSADCMGGWLDTMKTLVWDHGLKRLLPGTTENAEHTGENTAYRQVEKVHIALPEPRRFQIDGEDVGEVDDVVVTVQPDALRVRA